MLFFAAVMYFVPEPEASALYTKNGSKREKKRCKKEEEHLLLLGIYTALGISLHNFPEGCAVFMACLKGTRVALPLVLAIAAHNIPEGMAVAAPILHATNSKWQAFKWSLISGLCEPVGAIVFGVFWSNHLTEQVVQSMLAAGKFPLLFSCFEI